MKKILTVCLCAALALSGAATGESAAPEAPQAPEITAAPEAAEMVNPRVEAEDAGEILERLGIALAAPEGCEAVYTVIGGMTAEATFEWDGVFCTLRAARTQDDISGLFLEMEQPEEMTCEVDGRSLTVTFRAAADQSGYALYSWFDGQTQYCLIVQSDAAQPEASQALLEDVLPGCTQPSE